MYNEFLRFYIVVNDFTELIWPQISNFIKYINSLKSAPFYDSTHNFSLLNFYSEVSKDKKFLKFSSTLPQNVYGTQLILDDLHKSAKNLANYALIDFVIVIKLKDNTRDFKNYLPFLILLDQFQNVSLGVDITDELSTQHKDELLFSLGHIFSGIKYQQRLINDIILAEHTIFYICRNHPIILSAVGAFPTRSDTSTLILKKYSPIIEINKLQYADLFQIPFTIWLKLPLKPDSVDLKSLVYLFEVYDIRESQGYNISNLLIQRSISLLSKLDFSSDQITLLKQYLLNRPLLNVYIFCVMLDRYLLKILNTKNRQSTKYNKSIELISLDKFYSLIFYVNQFSEGLREIVENTILHPSNIRRGYLYFILRKKEEYESAFYKDPQIWFNESDYKNCFIHDTNADFYLEVFIIDSGTKGILPTYIANFKGSKEQLNDISFSDFFVGEYSHFPEESHLDLRYLAHLGLKSFSQLTIRANGYFYVESNNESVKDHLVASNSFNSYSTPIYGIPKNHFCNQITNEFIDGTVYNIILPVSDYYLNLNIPSSYFISTKSFSKIALTLLKDLKFYNSIYYCENIPEYLNTYSDYATLKDYIVSVAENIYADFKQSNKQVLVLDFRTTFIKVKSTSTLIKIVAFLQLKQPLEYIVIYNIKSDELEYLKTRLKVLSGYGQFWNQDRFLYLYDEFSVPFIVSGKSISACNSINSSIALYYGNCHSIDIDTGTNDIGSDVTQSAIYENSIIPFEILIYLNSGLGYKITLFESITKFILSETILDVSLGLKVPSSHIRLGSKIHIQNFYEAEILFQHGFFVERYAYLLSRSIIDNKPHYKSTERLILIGYGSYSEMLLNKIMSFINQFFQSKVCLNYIICKDVVDLKFIGIDDLLNYDTHKKEIFYSIIVPIGSTLSTNYKVYNSLNNFFEKEKRLSLKLNNSNILLNSSLITVRDKLLFEGKLTDLEKWYGWIELSLDNKNIKSKAFITENIDSGIYFSILLPGGWLSPFNCARCYPDNLIEEEILLETNKASVVPLNILGFPTVFTENHKKLNYSRLLGLKNCIKYGHLKRGNNHYQFYINTKNIFLQNATRLELEKWLQSLSSAYSSLLSDKNIFNCLVSVSHPTNTAFVDLVNEVIFNGSALILRMDLTQEFRDNIIIKYNYLTRLEQKIHFHFIDDSISTGQNVSLAKSYIFSIFLNTKKLEKVSIFSSVITILNRASFYRNREFEKSLRCFRDFISDLNPIYSYVYVYVPTIRDPENFCFICNARSYNFKLAKDSIFEKHRVMFKLKANKLRYIDEDLLEESVDNSLSSEKVHLSDFNSKYADPRHISQFFLTHQVYEIISECKSEKKINEKLTKIFLVNSDIIYRINFLKIISKPIFSYYISLRQFSLDSLINETNLLLNQSTPYQEIKLLHINALIILMKQLIYIKSNYIIRSKSLKDIWGYYEKIYNKLSPLIRHKVIFIEFQKLHRKMLNPESDSKVVLEPDVLPFADITKENNIKLLNDLISKKLRIEGIDNRVISTIIKDISDYFDNIDLFKLFINALNNLNEFHFIYASMIKELINDDESKSLRFEFLIRYGFEYNNEVPPSIEQFNTYEKNSIYNIKSDLKGLLQNKFRLFFNIIFNENISILNNAFDEIHTQISTLKNVNDKIVSQDDIKQALNNYKFLISSVLDRNPLYFINFIKFVGTSHFEDVKTIFSIKLLLKHFEPSKSNSVNTVDLLSVITGTIKNILNADLNFFFINDYSSDNKCLYKIAAAGEKNNEIDFEIDSTYFTHYKIFKDNTATKWFNYFSKITADKITWQKCRESKIGFSESIILQFLKINYIDQIAVPLTIGGITFLYDSARSLDERAQLKIGLKYLLFIKNDLQEFLSNNYSNHNLVNWINAHRQSLIIQNKFDKFYHGAGDHIEKMLIALGQNNLQQINSYALFVNADSRIGLLYSKILNKKILEKSNLRGLKLHSIFYMPIYNNANTFYSFLIDISREFDIKISLSIPSKVTTQISHKAFITIISEIVLNFIKNKKAGVSHLIHFSIAENDILNIYCLGVNITLTETELDYLVNNSPKSSIGLYTINKYLNSVLNVSIKFRVEKESNSIVFLIPLNRR